MPTNENRAADSADLATARFTLKGVHCTSFHPLRNILFGANHDTVAAFDCDSRKQLAETIKLPGTDSRVQWFQLLPDRKRLLAFSNQFFVVELPPAWTTFFAE